MFKRKYNPILSAMVWSKYKDKFNLKNIETISKLKFKKIFKGESEEAKQWYIHKVMSKWIDAQGEYSRKTMDRLKKIIKKIDMDLNQLDKHDLVRMEERVFFTERTLKKLDTNIDLGNQDNVFARFENAKLNILIKEKSNLKLINKINDKVIEKIKQVQKGVLLITTKKFIIISSVGEQHEFYFRNMNWYSHKKYGFEFNIDKNTYIIRTRDQKALNNMINLIFQRKAKNVIKKCKNN